MKVKSRKKEYIFVLRGNENCYKLLKTWEKQESILKRVLFHSNYKYGLDCKYLKIVFDKEYVLISIINLKAVVFSKSEFLKKECVAFYKFFYESKKSYKKHYDDIFLKMSDNFSAKVIDKILKLLCLDFLRQENGYTYDYIFSLISNCTILDKLFSKKITNKRTLFKEYFKSRYGKIDKLPIHKVDEILRNIEDFLKYDQFAIDTFFRLLRTSKNAHITINNFQKIAKYPHLKDLSLQAHYLKEKVNYNRSFKSLDRIHENFSIRILELQKNDGFISSKNIYGQEIVPLYNFHLLQNEMDFFIEGKKQLHCIYDCYKVAVDTKKWTSKRFYFSYRKEDEIIASLEVALECEEYEIIQLYGKRNSVLSEDLNTEIVSGFEKYYNDFFKGFLISNKI